MSCGAVKYKAFVITIKVLLRKIFSLYSVFDSMYFFSSVYVFYADLSCFVF